MPSRLRNELCAVSKGDEISNKAVLQKYFPPAMSGGDIYTK